MKKPRVRLDLSRHCIETAIGKRYNRLVERALRTAQWAEDTEAELELLKTALETFDFDRLRSVYPELAGRRTDLVELEPGPGGQPRLRVNGKPVQEPL